MFPQDINVRFAHELLVLDNAPQFNFSGYTISLDKTWAPTAFPPACLLKLIQVYVNSFLAMQVLLSYFISMHLISVEFRVLSRLNARQSLREKSNSGRLVSDTLSLPSLRTSVCPARSPTSATDSDKVWTFQRFSLSDRVMVSLPEYADTFPGPWSDSRTISNTHTEFHWY